MMKKVSDNFHGVKGKSGRKSWDKEIQAKALWDLSIPVLKFALKSKLVKLDKKVDIALALVNKMLPSELKGDGFKSDVIIQIIKPPAESADTGRRIPDIRASVAEASQAS